MELGSTGTQILQHQTLHLGTLCVYMESVLCCLQPLCSDPALPPALLRCCYVSTLVFISIMIDCQLPYKPNGNEYPEVCKSFPSSADHTDHPEIPAQQPAVPMKAWVRQPFITGEKDSARLQQQQKGFHKVGRGNIPS